MPTSTSDVTQETQDIEITTENHRNAPTGGDAAEKAPPRPVQGRPAKPDREVDAALKLPFPQYVKYAYQHRHSGGYTPLWAFTRLIRAHPETRSLQADEALSRVEKVLGWNEDEDVWMEHFGVPEEDATVEFLAVWDRIRYVPGADPVSNAIERARAQPLTTIRSRLNEKRYRGYNRFISVAGHLQVINGDNPILLPCESLCKAFRVRKMTISRWRDWGIEDGLLKIVKEHRLATREATLFRFNVRAFSCLVEAAKEGTADAFDAT